MTATAAPAPAAELTAARDLLREALLDPAFVSARFSGAQHGAAVPWPRVVVRPVLLGQRPHLQLVTTDGRQETARNIATDSAAAELDALLALPYKSVVVEQTGRTLRLQVSKKGRPTLHDEHHTATIPLELAHDRAKPTLLPDDQPVPFLHELGIMTADGRVRADQRRKFRQINEFLRLLDETGPLATPDDRPLRAIDLGCGSAALTFATYYYFNEIKQRPLTMTGVDLKRHLIERHRATAERLGWAGLTFATGRIADFAPDAPPDLVLALHACDTATDEALAQGVRWGSRTILSVPCCHHHLQAQMTAAMPAAASAVLRHGILRERLGDILTDTLRAQILQMLGYRTDIIEFVPVEHTPKNLMIRAVYDPARAHPARAAQEYSALLAEWPVRPYLSELLTAELAPHLTTN